MNEPKNYGLPWTAAEERKLEQFFNKGLDALQLAEELERPVNGVTSRLVKLGLIYFYKGAYYQAVRTPWYIVRPLMPYAPHKESAPSEKPSL